jgi:hypothetical protein
MKPTRPQHFLQVRFSSSENAVFVGMDGIDAIQLLPSIEAICSAVASADPDGNPCGLFRHPVTEKETTLVFGLDGMLHQGRIARLVEEMFVSCNNPVHVRIETAASAPAGPTLSDQVRRHLLPQASGGYADDDRPEPTWTWLCFEGKGFSEAAVDTYKAAGGDVSIMGKG